MKERTLFYRFITANQEGSFFESKIRKAMIVNLFSLVGISSLLYFFIEGIIKDKLPYSIVVGSFLFLTIANLVIFQLRKNIKSASVVVVFLMFLLEIALLVKIGETTTGLFWFYLFPLLVFFTLGNKKGLFFVLALLLIVIVYFKMNITNFTFYPKELHERFIITYIATSTLAFIFEYVRSSTFNAFVMADKEKTEYLEETIQQKEEIQTQAEILAKTNLELRQLSVAASETDSSIIITDKNTKIEWVNKGFTKMLKYTLDEFQSICPTLLECSVNKDKFIKCIEEKQSVTYQSLFELKDDSKIWVQSTVTPILNKKKEVLKLVIVETDITSQKIAEQEIKEKNEELQQQRDEILAQKDELLVKNEIISQKNDAINQSIGYARTIQRAILPDLKNFSTHFENFIIYKPKDIVSGDFYWLAETDKTNYIAVVDCTGHGVPGAFMSIMGSRILGEIVILENIHSPAKILEHLHTVIFNSLDQKNSTNDDGMDLILCKIDTKQEKKVITFCGAKRPLIYYNSETKEIKHIKGQRKSIGGASSKHNKITFEDEKITLAKESIIYLSSDGYIDQHNNNRKRIGSKSLYNLLQEIAEIPLEEQKDRLLNYLEKWQQNQMQTDDITIWGIKI